MLVTLDWLKKIELHWRDHDQLKMEQEMCWPEQFFSIGLTVSKNHSFE